MRETEAQTGEGGEGSEPTLGLSRPVSRHLPSSDGPWCQRSAGHQGHKDSGSSQCARWSSNRARVTKAGRRPQQPSSPCLASQVVFLPVAALALPPALSPAICRLCIGQGLGESRVCLQQGQCCPICICETSGPHLCVCPPTLWLGDRGLGRGLPGHRQQVHSTEPLWVLVIN